MLLTRINKFLLTNQNLAQTIAKNTFWLSVSQVLSRIIRAIIVIYAARILGVHGYGVFSYALAIAGLFAVMSDIGINWIIIRQVSESPERRKQLISTSLAVKSILLGFLFILLAIVAPIFVSVKESALILPIIAVLFVSDGIREFGYAVIRSRERMESEALINLFTNTLTVIVAWMVLQNYPTSYALALAYTGTSVVGTLVTLINIRKDLYSVIQNFNKELIKPLLTEAWPFFLMNLLWSILTYTDILMLGWLKTATEVGLYSAAQRPIQVLVVLPSLVALSILPSLSRFAHREPEKFNRLTGQAMAAVMLLAIPLVIGGIILANPIISLLYGPDYISATTIFIIMLISFGVIFPATIANNAILSLNWQKKFLPYMAIGAVLNIILNAILIPMYGGIGAAASTVTAQLIGYGLVILILQRRIKFRFFSLLGKIIASAAIMGFITWSMANANINMYLIILIAMVVYIGSLSLLRENLITRLVRMIR